MLLFVRLDILLAVTQFSLPVVFWASVKSKAGFVFCITLSLVPKHTLVRLLCFRTCHFPYCFEYLLLRDGCLSLCIFLCDYLNGLLECFALPELSHLSPLERSPEY